MILILTAGSNFGGKYRVYYFAAQRMQKDQNFADYIINEKYYISIPEILEFYTGIDRSRSDAATILTDDLKVLRETIEKKLGLPIDMNPYKHAKWITTKDVREKMKNELQENVLNSRLPESVKDQHADLNYDRIRPYNQTIDKFYENYSLSSLIQTIKASSRALRNSDYVNPEIKHKLLKEIQLGWELNMKILLVLSPALAIKGKASYDGQGYILIGGEKLDFEEKINQIIHSIPNNIIKWYTEDLYSPKMGSLLFKQIKSEENDLRRHLLALLVVSKRPRRWKVSVQNYLSSISKNSYYLLHLLQTLQSEYKYSFATPVELRELEFLIKSCYAKHEFGGKTPTNKNITKIPDKVIPERMIRDEEVPKNNTPLVPPPLAPPL